MIIGTTTYDGVCITTALDESQDEPAAIIAHNGIPERRVLLADAGIVRDAETGEPDIELTIAQIQYDYTREYLNATRQNKLVQTVPTQPLAA